MDAKRQKILRLLGTLNRSKRVAGPGFGDANLLPLVGQCPGASASRSSRAPPASAPALPSYAVRDVAAQEQRRHEALHRVNFGRRSR